MGSSAVTPRAVPGAPTHAVPAVAPVSTGARGQRLRVCVVGAGPRFLSGISYYTHRLIRALAARHDASAILVRQMMPTRLYPGRSRVGEALVDFSYPEHTRVLDGIDWYWGASIVRAVRLLRRERPAVLVLQWWTGTVLHSYLLLAIVGRLLGSRLIVEFHEVLDTAELNLRLARWYVRLGAPLLMRLAHGFVVHNEHDRAALSQRYPIGGRPTAAIPHGPYDHYEIRRPESPRLEGEDDGVCRLLYFGVIRPFKGVEDIITALELMSEEEVARFQLTVVGETWEGWTLPGERIASSPYREHIKFINRYVSDAEVAGLFAQADAVVLPYHRSSSSGPLHLAMAVGLPVVVTAVGGLVEACAAYEGAKLIPPRDPQALRAALHEVHSLRGIRFAGVHTWEQTVGAYEHLFETVGVRLPERDQ